MRHKTLFLAASKKLPDAELSGGYDELFLEPYFLYVRKGCCRVAENGRSRRLLISRQLALAGGPDGTKDAVDSSLEISHDASSKDLLIRTDRFASIPVYYCEGASPLKASDGLANFLRYGGIEPALAPVPAALFLMFGYSFLTRTLLGRVNSLHYGSELSLNKYSCSRYWRFPSGEAAEGGDYAGNLRRLLETQDRAVKEVLEASGPASEHVLFLSGGLDSRAILQSMMRSGTRRKIIGATIGKDYFEDVKLARRLCGDAGIEHRLLDFDFGGFHAAMTDLAGTFVDVSDNMFSTLPGGRETFRSFLGGKYLWLGTEPFSAYKRPEAAPPGHLAEDSGLLGISGEKLSLLGSALAPGRVIMPSLFTQILPPASPSLIRELGGELDGIVPSPAGDAAFPELTHRFRFKLWNLNRAIYEQDSTVVTPLHSLSLLRAYQDFPAAQKLDKLAFREANDTSASSGIPLHSKGISFDYFEWLRNSDTAVRTMLESAAASKGLREIFDMDNLEETFSPELLKHNSAALLLIRLYLLSLLPSGTAALPRRDQRQGPAADTIC